MERCAAWLVCRAIGHEVPQGEPAEMFDDRRAILSSESCGGLTVVHAHAWNLIPSSSAILWHIIHEHRILSSRLRALQVLVNTFCFSHARIVEYPEITMDIDEEAR